MLKKSLFFVSLFAFFSCGEDNLPDNCLRPASFSRVISSNNPDFNKALTPNGFAIFPGGIKGILLFNTGKSKNTYVAFDLICPTNDCNNQMVFENRLLKCTCDGSTYSVDIGGIPQTPGFICPALEYKVTEIGNSIRISNY
ncbi:Rieske (2Fe-2S) protein [Polaribacter butkevichii]|uniref:Rieske domain-containing protein n=1 Tax=Polaribacter butkevichii TaxID=218490 RepID=A0A2P6C6L5_9FLAO|nr:phosphoribosylaminoimidazole carboxylase [Polaribacter butkevichii]PQJ68571.1 hypothetical protein BTO14_10910 [Polaribacter butkevichii]